MFARKNIAQSLNTTENRVFAHYNTRDNYDNNCNSINLSNVYALRLSKPILHSCQGPRLIDYDIVTNEVVFQST